MFLSGLILSIVFGTLIVSIIVYPALLPPLDLPQSSLLPNGGHPAPPSPTKIRTPRQRALFEAKEKLEIERSKRAARLRVEPAHTGIGEPLTVGFYVNWDESSFSSLKENIKNLDIVIAEFLHLDNPDGSLREDNPFIQQSTTDYIRTARPDLKIMALVNNFNGTDWESNKLKLMLSNPAARGRCIQQLIEYVKGNNFAGISIDFESVPDEAQPDLNQFMQELAIAAHPEGLEISINLPVHNDSFDYKKLAASADYVILMVYDQHYSGSDPGPVAAIDWTEEVLRLRQMDVPASKTVVAVGNYAYDWQASHEPAVKTFEEAVITASESSGDEEKIDVHLDSSSLNPTFQYEESDGVIHTVWMLDAVSAFNQIVLARRFGARGVALWRLGSEDPSLWKFLGTDAPLNATTATTLVNMKYGYGLDYEGAGEILKVTGRPSEGLRDIKFDADRGMITSSKFIEFPSPYVITRYGGIKYKIALTFDDGPDPAYTPAILDALKAGNAPATFFVVGLNGEQYPGLLKRELNEGHEIGNHTFTHPNVATISDTQFGLELRATQFLFESILGRSTRLFRPPFAEDAEPDTPDEVHPLELVSGYNYFTIGMQIDPGDWKRPGVEAIVSKTVSLAQQYAVPRAGQPLGENVQGNIVLLHDSGGDRSQTVKALPLLIAALREHGFELVTVSDLMGRSRDDVMPPVASDLWWQTWAGRAAFATINFAIIAVHILFLIGIVLGIGRLLFIGTLAVIEHWRERHAIYDPNYSPTVAVIVPAFNEEKVIVQTITSLLASDHPPNFEIVVVDDGSSDQTYVRVQDGFADEPRVRLFTKPNSGKPDALNFGVAHTSAEIVIALDADTIFVRDTISKLVRHFADPGVGAVAGNAKVGNRINLLTRWQALEYITSQNLDRRAFNLLNCITVVPGAVGAWRRELVERAGGFTHLTLAEDADLTMAIRKLGYSIAYEDEAVGLTEAPDTLRGFIRQRYRWMYGTLQAAWKHSDALFRPRYGSLGFVALPNIFIFQVFFPLISPAMDLLMLFTLITSAINKWQHPAEFSPDSLWRALFYYAIFVALEFTAAVIAFLLEPKENKRLLVWLFWQRFFYRQLMYYVAIKSTLASLRGIAVGWQKLERKATVSAYRRE